MTGSTPFPVSVPALALGACWLGLPTAGCLMVAGHLGAHRLDWLATPISTYAASAPRGGLVTAAMWITSISMACLGGCVSWRRAARTPVLPSLASMAFGVAAAGLALIASYEAVEAERGRGRGHAVAAVRQQAFHDAGVMLFFQGSLAGFALSGLMVAAQGTRAAEVLTGMAIGVTGAGAQLVVGTSWPVWLGVSGPAYGLKQRAAYLAFGIAAVLLLLVMTREHRSIGRAHDGEGAVHAG